MDHTRTGVTEVGNVYHRFRRALRTTGTDPNGEDFLSRLLLTSSQQGNVTELLLVSAYLLPYPYTYARTPQVKRK
jgi:hypothetical protein